MEYVHVESGMQPKTGVDYSRASIRLSSRALVSLIHGLGRNNFGFYSVSEISRRIHEYRNRMDHQELRTYVDSGGYSLITGVVPFDKTQRFIECYSRYLDYENSSFDYIFSLDIPFWGSQEDTEHLTASNLYHFNRESLSQSIEIFERKPSLKEKWFFVWHFKYPTQFKVWSNLQTEFCLPKLTSNYAIGGQVSLRELFEQEHGRALDFSPFTAMAVKCFIDYLNSPLIHQQFKLHVLGIYHAVDRLQLIFLEELFRIYANEHHLPDPIVTHDTINYTLHAMYNARKLQPYRFFAGNFSQYPSIFEIEDDVLKSVYFDDELYSSFCYERNQLQTNLNFKNISFAVPLNVYSNLQLDAFLKDISLRHDFVQSILYGSTLDSGSAAISIKLHQLKKYHPSFFTDTFIQNMEHNLSALKHAKDLIIAKDSTRAGEFVNHFINMLSLTDPFQGPT